MGRAGLVYYSVVTAAVLIGIWLDIEPLACPVPVSLLSQPGAAPCFEFWFARYQTILAALMAIAGVIYATRPAIRQVVLAERQSLKERYRMLTELQKLFSPDDWLESQEKVPHPSLASFNEYMKGRGNPREALEKIFSQKCEKVRGMIEQAKALALDTAEREAIDALASELESAAVTAQADVTSHDGRFGRGGENENTYVWFYLVDNFDRWIAHMMRRLTARLEVLKAGVVADLSRG